MPQRFRCVFRVDGVVCGLPGTDRPGILRVDLEGLDAVTQLALRDDHDGQVVRRDRGALGRLVSQRAATGEGDESEKEDAAAKRQDHSSYIDPPRGELKR